MTHILAHPPESRQQDARVRRTREALRSALLALLDEQPFEQITIRDISARAGAGYATFFRHYPDKAVLLSDLAADEIRELLARALPILYAQDTRAACLALCGYIDERRELWSVLLLGGASGTLREEFLRQAREAALAAPKDRPHSRLPNDLAVLFGVSGVLEIFKWWLEHGRDLSVTEVADILDRLVIAPILKGR